MRVAYRLAVVLLLLVGGANAAEVTIRLSGLSFSPSRVTIQAGDSVRWINDSGVHNVVADDGSFRSGSPAPPGWMFTRTFNTPGTFGFYCEPHGAPGVGMAGAVTVQPAATTIAINEGLDGVWRDPNISGQGFLFEVNRASQLLVFGWFTWSSTTGEYLWYSGFGPYTGNRADVIVQRTRGGRFNQATTITATDAGTATITFDSCRQARVQFSFNAEQSPQPQTALSGTLNLTKLLDPGPECVESTTRR